MPSFVEDSQEVKEKIEYLYKIYPCSCNHRSNQSDFDVKDVKDDTNDKNQGQEREQDPDTPSINDDVCKRVN